MRLILLLLLTYNLTAQVGKPDTVHCDCKEAEVIRVLDSRSLYAKAVAPKGAGKINEISPAKQKTTFAFEKEHNTSWYRLVMDVSGELTFNITPVKAADDYDFMLFKPGGKNFCDSLQKYRISPIRACISRNKEEINGKTGLNLKATDEFVKHGVGSAYCKALSVKKGESYYLVLDNVYDNGAGHTIDFEMAHQVLLKGTVTNENNEPVKAEIAFTNINGDTLMIDNTEEDGSYEFMAPIVKYKLYDLHFYNENNFSLTRTFTLADTLKLKSLKTVLPQLKKGRKFSIGSINFIGGSVQYLSRSVPSMYNLARLLKKNPSLKIKIIGHCNGRWGMSEQAAIDFTKGRANSVKNYLTIQGIDEYRIEIDGKGDHEMLYKLPGATLDQQEENRRVEIMVLEF